MRDSETTRRELDIKKRVMTGDLVSKGTWDEFQKRCAFQHKQLEDAVTKLTANVGTLDETTRKLTDAVSGTTWFRQVMTGLIALTLGILFPSTLQIILRLLL